MPDRYFLSASPEGDEVRFDDQEAHHLAKVMRAAAGDQVVAFDGRGSEYRVELVEVGKRAVRGRVISAEQIDREAAVRLTLGVGLPKGDRQRWLVEKCVELGVARIVPLATARGVAQPVEGALARLRKYVIEASKQCGRNRLLEIAPAVSCTEMLQTPSGGARWMLHPGAEEAPSLVSGETGEVTALIGPEGGFADEEVALAQQHNWDLVGLGPRILRVETAAIAIAARVTLG